MSKPHAHRTIKRGSYSNWTSIIGTVALSWSRAISSSRKAVAADRPLVAYADFTDYALLICRSDNWREVFAMFFGRPESVRESFQRLYPIRLDTMHARPITQDDELLLYVETRRLVKIILGD